MISFKTKEDYGPSLLIIFSVIVVVAALAYKVLVPVPSPDQYARGIGRQTQNLIKSAQSETSKAKLDRAAIASRLWKGDANHVGASVLALVTSATSKSMVNLTAFRPQKPINLSGIVELPYAVQLVGPFTGVRSVMDQIDSSGSKVILRSVQVNASEELAGSVTATIGISAYISNDPEISADIPTTGGKK